jgi:HIRAN domain
MQTAHQQHQALYVAWQEPKSRRYYPVARLYSGVGNAHDLYEFAYINGATEAANVGFQPFLAFPKLHQVYRSKDMFPFFSNRLMSHNRPDFPNYLQSLSLDLNADPMAILARSGGTRATDSIEMFHVPPTTENGDSFQTFFWMHGYRYLDPQQQARILTLRHGEELFPAATPLENVDANAIRLLTADHFMVGYLPRYLAGEIIHFLNNGVDIHLFVERVNPPPSPSQQRLLCRLDARRSGDFLPFSGETYQPISPDATELLP